jgi:hypothetical protein
MDNQEIPNEPGDVVNDTRSQLNTVTPLSKYLAMTLFVILPFLGGWIGYTYAPEKVVEVEKVVVVEKDIETETRESLENIDRSTRGYLARNILTALVSPSGNTLTLVEYDNDPRMSNSCEGLFMTEEQRANNEVRTLPLDRLSCEVVIKTSDKELFYRDYELKTMGGKPYRWLDDTNIATHSTQHGGMGSPSFSTAGIFYTQEESFEEVFVSEQPGTYWRRKYVTHGDERFLFAEGSENYNLYRITSPRDFYDFFSIDESAKKTMVESLDPEKISELELIDSITHESEHQITVTSDLDKNILFTFGLPLVGTASKNTKNYLFDISANTIEPVEINWGM